MIGHRSPGRREMARRLSGGPPAVYTMRGDVPRQLEEDKKFWLLFQESKRLEAKLPASQARFNACINKLRVRARELMPEDMPR